MWKLGGRNQQDQAVSRDTLAQTATALDDKYGISSTSLVLEGEAAKQAIKLEKTRWPAANYFCAVGRIMLSYSLCDAFGENGVVVAFGYIMTLSTLAAEFDVSTMMRYDETLRRRAAEAGSLNAAQATTWFSTRNRDILTDTVHAIALNKQNAPNPLQPPRDPQPWAPQGGGKDPKGKGKKGKKGNQHYQNNQWYDNRGNDDRDRGGNKRRDSRSRSNRGNTGGGNRNSNKNSSNNTQQLRQG
jgi:hypothetical protein